MLEKRDMAWCCEYSLPKAYEFCVIENFHVGGGGTGILQPSQFFHLLLHDQGKSDNFAAETA